MEIRTFLAFELPDDIKDRVIKVLKDAKKTLSDIRWVKVGNIHLTVVFMGNIKEEDLPGIKKNISHVCSRYGAFHLSLSGAGVFPNKHKPNVLWLGLDGDTQRLSFFKSDLEKKFATYGIQQEKRRFKSHLTLGRFRKKIKVDLLLDQFLNEYNDFGKDICEFSRLTLFKSDLTPSGAQYTRLESWPLTGQK